MIFCLKNFLKPKRNNKSTTSSVSHVFEEKKNDNKISTINDIIDYIINCDEKIDNNSRIIIDQVIKNNNKCTIYEVNRIFNFKNHDLIRELLDELELPIIYDDITLCEIMEKNHDMQSNIIEYFHSRNNIRIRYWYIHNIFNILHIINMKYYKEIFNYLNIPETDYVFCMRFHNRFTSGDYNNLLI
jgi:hypothetical protein